MDLRLEQPAWLWVCVALVPMIFIALRWFAAMSAARRWSAILFRTALITLLALTLAQLGRVRTTESLAVVAVVDTSDSVRRFAGSESGLNLNTVQQALTRVDDERQGEDLLGIVAFDSAPRTIATPRLASVSRRGWEGGGGTGSNLEKAIEHALSMLPAESAGRIVLVSDGNQTAGDALDAARRAGLLSRRGANGARGVSIDVVPIEYDITREVMVESVDAPPQAAPGSAVNLRVTLFSAVAATGRIQVLDEGTPMDLNGDQEGDSQAVSLSAGTNVVVLPVQLDARRVHRFEVVFEPEGDTGDTFADNNRGSAFTLTSGKGSVLIVDGVSNGDSAGAGGVLGRTLSEAGIDVTTVAPEGFPADLLTLQRFDLVILQNVPAEALARDVQNLLVAHVRDFGAGLVMIGGPDSFAAGGWKGSAIEPILPVKLEIPDKVLTPDAAIMLVMDNSGSMAFYVMGSTRSKMEIANESAAAAVEMLDRRDLLGVITFNSDFDVLMPLSPNVDGARTAKKIRDISADGGTNLGPALEAATRQLQGAQAKVKHIIVVSDGRSQNHETLPGLARAANEQGIKVSTISVGDDADPATMAKIASEGGGRHHEVINPNVLPKVFLKAIRVVRAPYIKEQPFIPVITNPASPLISGLSALPRLGGLAMTDQRREPTVTQAIMTPANEPVLAHWNVGLGQVVAFTSDAHRWAADWLSSRLYREFWTRLCRTVARSQATPAHRVSAQVSDGRVTVKLETMAASGPALTVNATVYAPDGTTQELALPQVGPSDYENSFAAGAAGSYVVVARPFAAGVALPPVVTGVATNAGEEFRRLKSDRGLLEAIALASGGRVLSGADLSRATVFDRGGVVPQETWQALTQAVLIAALATLLLDVATRRIAWDRFLSRDFGADVAAAQNIQIQSSARAASTLSRLRQRDARGGEEQRGAAALTQEDAAKLALEQADLRRAARLQQWRQGAQASPDQSASATTSEPQTPAESGLLAAKRRAGRKFEE